MLTGVLCRRQHAAAGMGAQLALRPGNDSMSGSCGSRQSPADVVDRSLALQRRAGARGVLACTPYAHPSLVCASGSSIKIENAPATAKTQMCVWPQPTRGHCVEQLGLRTARSRRLLQHLLAGRRAGCVSCCAVQAGHISGSAQEAETCLLQLEWQHAVVIHGHGQHAAAAGRQVALQHLRQAMNRHGAIVQGGADLRRVGGGGGERQGQAAAAPRLLPRWAPGAEQAAMAYSCDRRSPAAACLCACWPPAGRRCGSLPAGT